MKFLRLVLWCVFMASILFFGQQEIIKMEPSPLMVVLMISWTVGWSSVIIAFGIIGAHRDWF